MSQTVPKIIIKRPVLAASPSEPTAPPTPTEEDENEEESGEMEEGSSQSGEIEATPVEPTRRPRGRPRGRGRGATSASPAPRGRGRGRGRPRGGARGRGFAFRVVKAADEDMETDQDGGGDEINSDERPVGGGKPFKVVGGVAYVIDGDELVIEDDPKGDEKIDKWGNLLGGRVFKANTFILPSRHPQRIYMLAIDAARSSGFRDSLYYFRRNPLTHKLNATQTEKDYLIEQGKLGSHLKTRSVTLITARSVFKLHGAKTIKDGRWIIDDYYESKVLAEIEGKGISPGELVGELPDPNAPTTTNDAREAGGKSERSGGTKGIYQAGGPTTIFGGSGWGPFSDGPLNAVRKSLLSRDGVTEENYMHQAALKALDSSEHWSKLRRQALGGSASSVESAAPEDDQAKVEASKSIATKHPLSYYEPHTGFRHYPISSQPTQSRWESRSDRPYEQILSAEKTGSSAWGLAWVDTIMEPVSDVDNAEIKHRWVEESVQLYSAQ